MQTHARSIRTLTISLKETSMNIGNWRWLACVALACIGSAQAQAPARAAATPDLELPALSREWSGADYAVVTDAIAQGQLALPRFGSKESGPLMHRLVAEENLVLQANSSIPLQARLGDFLTMSASLGQLAMRYALAANNGEDLHAELAALMAMIMRESASGAALVSQWIEVMPRDDKYETRMKGLAKIKSGITQVLLGEERSLGESLYSAADRSLLIDAMADSIEPLKAFLAPEVKQELRRKLGKHRGSGTAEDDRNLDRLIRSLDG
jgi:hypothetical protein